MGQGVNTVAQQVVAEETGLSPALIDVVVCTGRRHRVGMTTPAAARRSWAMR